MIAIISYTNYNDDEKKYFFKSINYKDDKELNEIINFKELEKEISKKDSFYEIYLTTQNNSFVVIDQTTLSDNEAPLV